MNRAKERILPVKLNIPRGNLKPLTEFDEYEFKFAVNRVLVDSESCTFELKNGMKFKEIF